MQRRTTSFQSRLSFKHSWFPQVNEALGKISDSVLRDLEIRLRKDPNTRPHNESEIAAFDLLKYMKYMSEHISGSTAEINNMCEEIRAVICFCGLPHLFITLNPADSHNPLYQFLAGCEIDIDKFFHDLSPNSEHFQRQKTAAQNPVASAKAFHLLMQGFLQILSWAIQNR